MGRFRLTVQWAGIPAMRGIRMRHDIDELLDWGPNVAYYECALPAALLQQLRPRGRGPKEGGNYNSRALGGSISGYGWPRWSGAGERAGSGSMTTLYRHGVGTY